MSTSFTRTRNQIADMVLRKLGVLAAGGTADSDDTTIVYEAIDLRLKELHRLGIFWRKVTKTPLSFTITANTNSASASADVLFPIAMHVVDGSRDAAVDIISINEYAGIQDKTEAGVPTKALWNGSAEFLFWPVPIADTTAKLIYEKIIDDTSASAAPDIEVSMMRWLKDIVAYDLGDDFGLSDNKMARFMRESEMAERKIRSLAVQRVDYPPVAVDDFDGQRMETDYCRVS